MITTFSNGYCIRVIDQDDNYVTTEIWHINNIEKSIVKIHNNNFVAYVRELAFRK